MNNFNSFNMTSNRVEFSLEFFTRVFIQNPITGDKKPLSGLSLRLIAVLLQHLSLFEARRLPPRSELAKILNVSKTAITDSLIQLEDANFIYPVVSPLQGVVWADPEREKEMKEMISHNITNQKKQRRFSGYFQINPAYNVQVDEQYKDDILKTTREQCRNFIKEKIPNISEKMINDLINQQKLEFQLEELLKKQKDNGSD